MKIIVYCLVLGPPSRAPGAAPAPAAAAPPRAGDMESSPHQSTAAVAVDVRQQSVGPALAVPAPGLARGRLSRRDVVLAFAALTVGVVLVISFSFVSLL